MPHEGRQDPGSWRPSFVNRRMIAEKLLCGSYIVADVGL
jgi:hypothetical protein